MEKRKTILVYDLAVLPVGLKLRDIVFAKKNDDLIFWCSAAHSNMGGKENNNPPFLIDKDSLERIVDENELSKIKDISKK